MVSSCRSNLLSGLNSSPTFSDMGGKIQAFATYAALFFEFAADVYQMVHEENLRPSVNKLEVKLELDSLT